MLIFLYLLRALFFKKVGDHGAPQTPSILVCFLLRLLLSIYKLFKLLRVSSDTLACRMSCECHIPHYVLRIYQKLLSEIKYR